MTDLRRTPGSIAGGLRRGRVMIAGAWPSDPMLQVRWSCQPLVVQNLFEAIGELSAASPSRPIDLVIVNHALARQVGRAAMQALRRVDPAVQVLTVSPDRSTSDALSLEADGCLHAGLSRQEVLAMLNDHVLTDGNQIPENHTSSAGVQHEAAGQVVPMRQPPPIPVPHTSPPPIPFAGPVAVELADEAHLDVPAAGATEAKSVTATSPESLPHASAAAAEPRMLGDVDLVEAALLRPDQLRDLALQLVREHTRLPDLRLVDHATGNASESSVEVAFGERRFGWLCSETAFPSALAPWAAWLARWLALDQDRRALQTLAYQDDLTGAWNRRYFERFVKQAMTAAARVRRPVTLMVFDIDNFKSYNDNFGHEAGDEVLRETVRLMQSSVRPTDRVCRIGGDEFVVVFADLDPPREKGSAHPESIEFIAKRFQDQICQMKFPKLGIEAPGTLSISAGLATFPWDGSDLASLLRHADQLALESKRKGKNVITFGPGAAAACRPKTH